MTSEFEDKFILPSQDEIDKFGGKDGFPRIYISKEYKAKENNSLRGWYAQTEIGMAVMDSKRVLNADFGEEKKDYDLGI